MDTGEGGRGHSFGPSGEGTTDQKGRGRQRTEKGDEQWDLRLSRPFIFKKGKDLGGGAWKRARRQILEYKKISKKQQTTRE